MRRYRGSSAAERQADRRVLLIDAAIAVYAQAGHERASVRRICQAAGLSERYFYESFANGDELLAAAFDHAAGAFEYQLLMLGRGAGRSVLLTTYFEAIRGHPELARLFVVEGLAAGGPIMARFDDLSARLSRILCGLAPDERLPPERAQLLIGVAGGLFHIGRQWIMEGFATPFPTVLAAAERLCALIDEDMPAHA